MGRRAARIRGRRRTATLLGAVTAVVAGLLLTTGVPAASATAYASPAGGTREVTGPVLDRYLALGGPSGLLGAPLTDQVTTPGGAGRFNHFERGSIYWSAATGAHQVGGAIRDRWAGTGWEGGFLGFPATDEIVTPNRAGHYNHFQGGSVYWSAATGAHSVSGPIGDRWAALGWENGFLGFPATDELITPNGTGHYEHFQGGSVYWSAATGAHQVGGAIRDRWAGTGWENGFLGYPTSDEIVTPNGAGHYNHFQRGSVYWSAATGAHSVSGPIGDRWAALGWENSPLGFPATDELITPNGTGHYEHFQGGSVYWSAASGAHSVSGAIRDRWGASGWENGPLGFPTSEPYGTSAGQTQDFQGGRISWTGTGGAVVSTGLPLGVVPPGTQVVTVVAPSAGSTTATLTAWQRGTNGWTPVVGPVTARVGAAGVGAASETTTRTPVGTFRLSEAFGRAANPGTALPYRVIDRNDWWVSDAASGQYNQYARCAPGTCPFDERAGENLYAAGAVYDNAVVIDYNRSPAVRGAGSAFFLHITNGTPTAGCVAIDRAALQQVMRWLQPGSSPVVAIGVG